MEGPRALQTRVPPEQGFSEVQVPHRLHQLAGCRNSCEAAHCTVRCSGSENEAKNSAIGQSTRKNRPQGLPGHPRRPGPGAAKRRHLGLQDPQSVNVLLRSLTEDRKHTRREPLAMGRRRKRKETQVQLHRRGLNVAVDIRKGWKLPEARAGERGESQGAAIIQSLQRPPATAAAGCAAVQKPARRRGVAKIHG